MIDTSKLNKDRVTAARVAQRMRDSSDIKPADLTKFLTDFKGTPIERSIAIKVEAIRQHGEYGGILDAEHHLKCAIKEVIRSAENTLGSLHISADNNPSNSAKYLRGLTDSLDIRIVPALAGMEPLDVFNHAHQEYEAIKKKYKNAIGAVDSEYPKINTAIKERIKKYQPHARELLDSSKSFCESILRDVYESRYID